MSDTSSKNIIRFDKNLTLGVLTLTSILTKRAKAIIEANEVSERKISYIKILVKGCEKINKVFDNSNEMEDSRNRNIKSIFYRTSQAAKEIAIRDMRAFNKRDEKKRIVAIIPDVDIGLIYNELESEEKEKVWSAIQTVFINSVRLFKEINPTKINDELMEHVETVTKKLNESDYNPLRAVYNVYEGIDEDAADFSIDDVVANAENADKGSITKMLADIMAGRSDVDKMIRDLKFSEDDMREALSGAFDMFMPDNGGEERDAMIEYIAEITRNLKSAAANGDTKGMGLKELAKFVEGESAKQFQRNKTQYSRIAKYMSDNVKNSPLMGSDIINTVKGAINTESDPKAARKKLQSIIQAKKEERSKSA